MPIRKLDDKYFVYSNSGKKLSKGYKTRKQAAERLKQIEYYKNKEQNG